LQLRIVLAVLLLIFSRKLGGDATGADARPNWQERAPALWHLPDTRTTLEFVRYRTKTDNGQFLAGDGLSACDPLWNYGVLTEPANKSVALVIGLFARSGLNRYNA
jgi:hypothetical protein